MPPQNPNPIVNPEPSQNTEKSFGPIIGIIVIIAIIILGGLYFWGQRVSEQKNGDQSQNTTIEEDATLSQLQNQGSSDDVSSIEADLNATNVNNLGNEVINAEAAAAGAQ